MAEKHTGSNFQVFVAPIELSGNFTSVSGLGVEMEMEHYREGGNFTGNVEFPVGLKYSNIVLQRGTMTAEPLSVWFSSVQYGIQQRYPMIVTMLSADRKPVKIWTVTGVLPVKIDYSPMNALSESVSITSIEFTHGEILYVL